MRFSALLAVPMALVGLAVPAYAEDPGLTITWPTITEVQVSNTDYIFNIADIAAEPQGTLYAEWQGERQEIPHTGDYAMTFAKGGTGTITVVRCVPAEPEPACTEPLATSPELTVWRLAAMELTGAEGLFKPGTRTAAFRLPDAPNTEVEINWFLQGSEESGQSTVTTDGEGRGTFQYTLPAGDGSYFLHARSSFDLAPFGPHRGSNYGSIDVDDTAPAVSLRLSGSAVYPVRDGYRDSIGATIEASESSKLKMELVNSAGKVARTVIRWNTMHASLAINGRTASGALLPQGTYRLRVTATDRVGHEKVSTRFFTVSHKKLVKKTWTRTFKAGATLTRNGAFVQACSTLRKPSLRGWAGSLGYYSRAKCNRDNADIVSTTNGIYVPTAFQNRYGTYQVSFYGGGARGTRGAYIVMGYLNNKNAFTHRIQGGAQVRSYAGKVASAGNFVHDKTTRPYVLWTAGLTDGSRYDVKSFTVKLTYTALQ